MILERLEPKNSEKVAVGGPGRPFELANGLFSALGFGSPLHLPVQPWLKKCNTREENRL